MPTFGGQSKQHLATCHHDVSIIMNEVIKVIDCSVLEGWRPDALQEQYFERGLSTKRAGQSTHNARPSKAWHALPYFSTPPHIDWKHEQSMFFLAGIIIGTAERLFADGKISHRVRWGGDWDRDFDVREKQWNDLAHYELIPGGTNA